MKTKIISFGLMFSLMFSPAFAQESLLDDTSDGDSNDLFGDDFFGDLDSFLEESETAEETVDDSLLEAPIIDENVADVAEIPFASEVLQNSAPSTQGDPGFLPESAEVSLSVINVSKDNADATSAGARPGDVLRYEIALNSKVDDVIDYVPTIDISAIEGVVEFTNTGFGVIENGMIVYPAYSHQAPCEQVFTFFVRVKENCAEQVSLVVNNQEAGSVSVPLSCGLSETGPTQSWILLLGAMMLLFVIGFGLSGRAKNS